MNSKITVELYTGGLSPLQLSQRLARAGLQVRSIGVEHVFVDVAAETPSEAEEAVRQALPNAGLEPRSITSYLDRAVRLVAA